MTAAPLQRLNPPQALGKLTLLGKLGEGGMASVFVAAVGAGALSRLAAVKLLRHGAPDHDYRTRFLDEAKVVVRLHHNNVVDVREAGEVDGQLFIVMELCEGRDLSDVWDRCAALRKAFPVPLAVHIVREILRGLHYAHTFPGLGLVHRDVSPSNILIDWEGAVRLADFGLATSAVKASATVPGMVFGKVGYMSPEQAMRKPLDGRADVYGCGVVLWELLTGRPLRDGGIDTQRVADFKAPPPSRYSKRVDPDLDAIVVKALARDRKQRYGSALTLMEALTEWLSRKAPQTTQETVSAFLATLFGDAREKDRAVLDELQTMASGRPTAEVPKGGAAAEIRGVPRAVPSHEHITAGTVISERYRVLSRLGQGGMGTVYMGEHVTVGRNVAIKVLTHEWSAHPIVAKRFRKEARAASAARHPNIVEVFDAGELPDRRLYLVMELLSGRSVFEEIRDNGPMDPLRACDVMRGVALAVRAAHAVGIIHRDLKPDNVMLCDGPDDAEQEVKVLDFGIAASMGGQGSDERLTLPGHALGTPEYMAPEQAKGHRPTERFDLYSMGALLYEMLVGEPPFLSEDLMEVLQRKATEPAPSLARARDGLPETLVNLVDDCLATHPEGRPQSAQAFLDRLEAARTALNPAPERVHTPTGMLPAEPSFPAIDAEPAIPSPGTAPSPAPAVSPSPAPAPSRPVAAAARRPVALVLAAAGALGLVAGIAVFWSSHGPEDATDPAPAADVAAASATPASTRSTSVPADTHPVPGPDAVPPEAPPPTVQTSGSSPPGPSRRPPPRPKHPEAKTPPSVPEGTKPEPTPQPKPELKPGPTAPTEAQTPACKRHRAAAVEAVRAYDWPRALQHLGHAPCWDTDRDARRRMLVKAYVETKRFDRCVSAGRGARDKATQRLVEMCRRRVE